MSRANLRQPIPRRLDAVQRDELAEEDLKRLLELADADEGQRQDLLYLQTASPSLNSQVLGMMLVRDGALDKGPSDPTRWSYQTILDAIRDGWRVILFPDLALLMNASLPRGLGCEFILEK